jgi:uncharacterized protein (TIRG00374 family)
VYALRGVSLRDIVSHLREANVGWLLLSSALVTSSFPLRAIRWRILLTRSGVVPPYRPLWRAVAIGFMANNVLPARAGELVRGWAATALADIPFTTAVASIAVERIFDGVVIVLLLALAIGGPGMPAGAVVGSTSLSALAATMGALFVGILVFVAALARNQARVLPVAERLTLRLLPSRVGARAVGVLDHLAAGLAVLHSTRDVLRVVVWSFVVWLVNAASFYAGFLAFHIRVPLEAALVLQGIVAFGVALPSTPGFFGVYEGLSRASLGIFGVPGAAAVSFAIGLHLCWFVPITAIGLVILTRAGLSLRELRAERPA